MRSLGECIMGRITTQALHKFTNAFLGKWETWEAHNITFPERVDVFLDWKFCRYWAAPARASYSIDNRAIYFTCNSTDRDEVICCRLSLLVSKLCVVSLSVVGVVGFFVCASKFSQKNIWAQNCIPPSPLPPKKRKKRHILSRHYTNRFMRQKKWLVTDAAGKVDFQREAKTVTWGIQCSGTQ